MPILRRRWHLLAAMSLVVLVACWNDAGDETALDRGDRAYARGDFDEALAEYRLSLLQDDPGVPGIVRGAHAYVALGRVDEALALYEEAVALDSTFADQAMSDFVGLARRLELQGDRFGVASAMEAALTFRPGLIVEDLALPLARHYSVSGEYGRALPLFQRALANHRDDRDVIFETAMAHEEIGDCETALIFFEEYKEGATRSYLGQVDWHVGSCSFQVAKEMRAQGRNDEALTLLEDLLEVGEPRTLLGRAWFDKGQILAEEGQCAAAVEAFREVPIVDPSGGGPLARRARDRADEIRFSRGDRVAGDPC